MLVAYPSFAGRFENHKYCTKIGEMAHYAMTLRQQGMDINENKQLVYSQFKDYAKDEKSLVFLNFAVDYAYQEPSEYKITNRIKQIENHEKLFYDVCFKELNNQN